MKHKLTILLIGLFLITILNSCQTERENKSVGNIIDETAIETTVEPTIEPTEEPLSTVTPEVTPDTEENEEPVKGFTSYVMTQPPFSYYAADNLVDKEVSPIKLNIVSKTANEIIEIEDWFTTNNLFTSFSQRYGSLDELTLNPTFFGDDNFYYDLYNSENSDNAILNIYETSTDGLLYTLDFSNYVYSPEYKEEDYEFIEQKIRWAIVKDDILYVSHSHNTYAKSSNNMNGYITAISLTDGSILWRSDALVCNSINFIIIDDVILSGYGFTAEPDYLYQINRYTGKVIDKITLKSAPEYIIKKDSEIYVRTYNTDYKFSIQ